MFSNKKNRLFRFYALIHEGNVFIGKTQGEIDPVYYRHRRAENPFTASYFYPKNSKHPSIHILETIACNPSESYRHIVAWVRIFQDAGYSVINPEGTLEDAQDLHNQTVDLIRKLRPRSIDVFLKETLYQQPRKKDVATNEANIDRKAEKKSREKITLWTTPVEKECFVAYAKYLRMTQAQAFRYIMQKAKLQEEESLFPNWEDHEFIRALYEKHTKEIEKKEQEIYELKTALRRYVERKERQAKKLKQCCAIARKSLIDVYALFDSTALIPLDIERARYSEYISQLSKDAAYTYPEGSGAALLRLQALLLGDGNAPARFVLGIDSRGNRIMLRYYPSSYFWGISPRGEQFSQRNSVWYMAWRKSGEVAELIVALPVQIKAKYQNPMDENEKMHHFADRLMEEVTGYNF